MRSSIKKLSDDLYLLKIKKGETLRYFVIGEDYELSYELFSLIDDGEFNEKEFFENININMIKDTLDEVNNRDEFDCLYHDMDETGNPIIKGDDNE